MRAILASWILALALSAGAATECFVFDNGVGRGSWPPERQAKTLKDLGFDGISYNYTNPKDLAVWQKAFKDQGLKIYGIYVFAFLDQPEPFAPHLREAIKLLKGTGTVVWLAVREPKTKGDYEAKAVEVVREIAELAKAEDVQVALYGHAGFYVANAADADRLSKAVARTNVGPSINLCHEFMSKQGDKLAETVKTVAPRAVLASINGMDAAGPKYLRRLDEGDFDVADLVRKLQAAGYHGPIGIQCYSVTGDTDENLKATRAAWERIRSSLKPR